MGWFSRRFSGTHFKSGQRPILKVALNQKGGVELAVVVVVLVGILLATIALLPFLNTGDRVSQAQSALSGTTNQRLYLAYLGSGGTHVLMDPSFLENEMRGYAKRLGKLATRDGVTHEPVCVSILEITNAGADCSGAVANETLPSLSSGTPPIPQKIDSAGNQAFDQNGSFDTAGCATDAVKDAAVRSFSSTCDHSFPFVVGVSFTELPGVVTAKRIDSNPFGGVIGLGIPGSGGGPGLPGKSGGTYTP